MYKCDRTHENDPLDVKIDFEIKALKVRAHFKTRSTNPTLYIYRKSESLLFSLSSGLILSSRLAIKGASVLVKDNKLFVSRSAQMLLYGM